MVWDGEVYGWDASLGSVMGGAVSTEFGLVFLSHLAVESGYVDRENLYGQLLLIPSYLCMVYHSQPVFQCGEYHLEEGHGQLEVTLYPWPRAYRTLMASALPARSGW